MEMSGEERIAASREQVWAALNNPKILRTCIPSCESLEAKSPTEFVAVLKVKLGPLSRSLKCTVTLSDLVAPESYRISVEGGGGFAGKVTAGSEVTLAEADGGTLLTYKTTAKLGGKLALLGSKLLDTSSKKLAAQFFAKFGKVVAKRNA